MAVRLRLENENCIFHGSHSARGSEVGHADFYAEFLYGRKSSTEFGL